VYDLDTFMDALEQRVPDEPVFHQAVRSVARDIIPILNETPRYRDAAILERLTEPDRFIAFRVAWMRDDGSIAVNRGYRVQFNGAIGPYKGGLRFHPGVCPSVLKFLGFEQVLKNALTGLPMGGAKGGADLDPSDCSEREVERFCQAFMAELHRHIGPDRDVPAGDINVGAREVGYLFGAYRRITGRFEGVITGKGESYGGSELRTEATGFGLVYFLREMLTRKGVKIEKQRVAISGAGNVALHAADKAIELGANVITLSDSGGLLVEPSGFTPKQIDWIRELKGNGGDSLEAYTAEHGGEWHAGQTPWQVECDIALPCATENELDVEAAQALIGSGCLAIAEGANMPLTAEAEELVRCSDVLYGPAKAANAGGVAVSGLEIWQNRRRRSVSRRAISEALVDLMAQIHERCAEAGSDEEGRVDYARGANIVGFRTVADAMVAQGIG